MTCVVCEQSKGCGRVGSMRIASWTRLSFCIHRHFETLDSGKLVHSVRSAALVVLEPLVALLHDGFSYLVEISNQRAVANSPRDA